MRRRDFLAFAVAAWPLAALAQQASRKPVIGYLSPNDAGPVLGHFKEGLRRLGYVDGETIQIEYRSADGKPERLSSLAQELVRLKVDVLVAYQTPSATAAKNATRQIPVVMAGTGDPVGTGLVVSLARPGGNITGIGGLTTDFGAKVLELIREVLPHSKRIGVLANANDPFTKPFLRELRNAGRDLELEMDAVMIREATEIESAIANMARARADALVVQPSLPRRAAAESALKHRLPSISPSVLFPEDGGLFGYASDLREQQQVAATFVDRILKGAKPADLPVQQSTIFQLVVNLKSAETLGIKIPSSMLLRADRVIE